MKSGFSRWRRRGMPSGANLFFVDGVLVPRLSQLWILKAVWWARVHSVRMQDPVANPTLFTPSFLLKHLQSETIPLFRSFLVPSYSLVNVLHYARPILKHQSKVALRIGIALSRG